MLFANMSSDSMRAFIPLAAVISRGSIFLRASVQFTRRSRMPVNQRFRMSLRDAAPISCHYGSHSDKQLAEDGGEELKNRVKRAISLWASDCIRSLRDGTR